MDLSPRLPTAPLQRAIVLKKRSLGMSWEELGDYLAVTPRTLHRVMSCRWIGFFAADHMAIRLGLHPALLWPSAWSEEAAEGSQKKKEANCVQEKLRHTKRIAALLAEGRKEEAVGLHDAHVRDELEKAKQGMTIDLSDLMAAKEILTSRLTDADPLVAQELISLRHQT
ncbi:MAG: hypothetical protein ACRDJ4_12610 [Actinomycetota bacterium]